MTDTHASLGTQLPGETREQWDRRRRDRLRIRPGDIDPLAGTFVVSHHRDVLDVDGRGRPRATPRVVEYDLLMDKCSNRVVARRYADGTLEWFSEPSGPPHDHVQSVTTIVPKRESTKAAKPTEKIISREAIPLVTETTYDADGTERVVVRRQMKPI